MDKYVELDFKLWNDWFYTGMTKALLIQSNIFVFSGDSIKGWTLKKIMFKLWVNALSKFIMWS